MTDIDNLTERLRAQADQAVTISVEGRNPEPADDVLPRLAALVNDLRAIPGIAARIDITVSVTMDSATAADDD